MTIVRLHKLADANETQQKFADSAIAILQGIVQDARFIQMVRSGKFSRRRLRVSPDSIIEATNEQIVGLIETGKEYRSSADGTIDITAKLGVLGAKVVGKVDPPNPLITTNVSFLKKWMKNKDPLSLSAHWMHEWLHVAGFRHAKKKKVDRNDVNYLVGSFVVKVGRERVQAFGISRAVYASLGQGYLDAYKEHAACVEEDEEEEVVTA